MTETEPAANPMTTEPGVEPPLKRHRPLEPMSVPPTFADHLARSADVEAKVGIRCRRSLDLPRFKGLLKQRYSDFIVHEIGADGRVVVLRNTAVPPSLQGKALSSSPLDAQLAVADVALPLQSCLLQAALEELRTKVALPEEDLKVLFEALASAASSFHLGTHFDVRVENDKEKRRQLHEFIREKLPIFRSEGISQTNTVTADGYSLVRLRPRFLFGRANAFPAAPADTSAAGPQQQQQHSWHAKDRPTSRLWQKDMHYGDVYDTLPLRWRDDVPSHLHFTLFKENVETMHAMSAISRCTGARTGSFQIAGLKDRRGMTTQRVSLFRAPAEKITVCNGKIAGIAVGDFSYEQFPLSLGSAQGNRFTLVFRRLEAAASEDSLAACMSSFQANGFLNYFGLQRFGTGDVLTHEVGVALLRKDYERMIHLLLGPRGGKFAARGEDARRYWATTGDARGTLERTPKSNTIERIVLEALCSQGEKQERDFLGAFRRLPRNSKLLYLHAFQSLVFNELLSARVELFGCERPVVGDLVAVSRDDGDTATGATAVSKRHQRRLAKGLTRAGDDPAKDSGSMQVKVLETEDEAATYSIADVVLPLPGSSVAFPRNAIKDVYDRLLEKYALVGVDFRTGDRDTWLPGQYRHIVVRPGDVEHAVVRHSDPDERLVLSDLDRLAGVQPAIGDGPFRALVLSFSLPSGSYATMAMREILTETISSEGGDGDESEGAGEGEDETQEAETEAEAEADAEADGSG